MMNLTTFTKKIKTHLWLKSNKDFWVTKLLYNTFQANKTSETQMFSLKSIKENTLLRNECGGSFLYLTKGIATVLVEKNLINIPAVLINIENLNFDASKSVDFLMTEFPFFVNPILKIYLENFYPSEIIDQIGTNIFELDEKIVQFDWTVNEIGVYNIYKHFPSLSDLNALEKETEFSSPLLQLIGKSTSNQKQQISPRFLFESDSDQSRIFNKLEDSSLIIQGPPGTGKTQTLANITGSFIADSKKVLVVSEKKAALDVLESRLKERNLAILCMNSTERLNEKFIFNDLKETWLKFEKLSAENNYKITNSNELISSLDFWFGDKQNEVKNIAFALQKSTKSGAKINIPIAYNEWIKETHFLSEIDNSLYAVLSLLKSSFFENQKHIQDTRSQLIKYTKTLSEFSLQSHNNLEITIRKCTDFVLYKSDTFKKYGHLIEKKKARFLTIRKKWNQLQNKKSLFNEKHLAHWLKIPTQDELKWLNQLYQKDGFFANRKWKNEWKNWVRTSELSPEELFQQLTTYFDLLEQENTLTSKLSELNIESSSEIETIFHFLSATNEEEYAHFSKLSPEYIDKILAHQSDFMEINRLVSQSLDITNETSLIGVLKQIENNLELLFQYKNDFLALNNSIISQLKHFDSYNRLNDAYLLGRWAELAGYNAKIIDSTPTDVHQGLVNYQLERENEAQVFATEILSNHVRQFEIYHQLMATENRKLSDEQKEWKAKLKKGKSILVKEFSKQKKHLTLRQLLDSEAADWVFLLKPIWLTNPATLSLSFPMKRELFDIVLFDEAGRIPLSNALGALQRAKKCVVAGDSQQMEPSHFFQQEVSDENYSLLHQATFYLDNVLLSHHYRSFYPELISFSNSHFYNNELTVFPSAFRPEISILKFHYVANGKYIDRTNLSEALQLATFYHSLTDLIKEKNKIGIVAFSESQLQCIWNCFSESQQNEVLHAIDQDRLFFKTLEQVQGDECDILLISFGYGKNANGNFEMRFGPLNQLNGDKRLNVLFSRARKSIQFFASVKAADFPISENPSIRTLWKWFTYIENTKSEKAENNKLDFLDFIQKINSKDEAAQLIKMYEHRGWKFTY